jgi:cytochrome c oxidase subunit 3
MGAPVSNGKLAMWVFLATEIMFFTGLIGTYMVLRNGMPTTQERWPNPHDVHLVEWIGAFNTFVLICSSLTVVLAHWELGRSHTGRAILFIAVTFALGAVFLFVKAIEYKSKLEHGILPGQVFDRTDGPYGQAYLNRVRADLERLNNEGKAAGPAREQVRQALDNVRNIPEAEKVKYLQEHLSAVSKVPAHLQEKWYDLLLHLDPKAGLGADDLDKRLGQLPKGQLSTAALPTDYYAKVRQVREGLAKAKDDVNRREAAQLVSDLEVRPGFGPARVAEEAKAIHRLHEEHLKQHPGESHGGDDELHLARIIPFGNIWASCYFAMTGFHAIHVLGGLVIFAIILIRAALGQIGLQQGAFFEMTGLYWHFVDIVWIFLFPLLYLV